MEIKEEDKSKEILENNIINEKLEDKKEEIDPLENEKTKIKVLMKEANEDMQNKNYQKAEEKYNLIIEEKNKEILENIKENMIDILNNYALSFYYQMKYEQAAKILYNIIINYDNKNTKAYILLVKILCDINEYNKARLLIDKINKILKLNEEESSEINEFIEVIEKYFKRKNNNIQRQFYFNKEKEIFNFRKKLNFFYWCFYSFVALIIGHYLSKLL